MRKVTEVLLGAMAVFVVLGSVEASAAPEEAPATPRLKRLPFESCVVAVDHLTVAIQRIGVETPESFYWAGTVACIFARTKDLPFWYCFKDTDRQDQKALWVCSEIPTVWHWTALFPKPSG